MSQHSLYCYHAEWPLMTRPWINAEGCRPTAEEIRAAPNNLLLGTTAVNQQISAWARTKKWGIIGWHALQRLGRALFQDAPLVCVQRRSGADILLHTSSVITLTTWDLPENIRARLLLQLLLLFPTILSSQSHRCSGLEMRSISFWLFKILLI